MKDWIFSRVSTNEWRLHKLGTVVTYAFSFFREHDRIKHDYFVRVISTVDNENSYSSTVFTNKDALSVTSQIFNSLFGSNPLEARGDFGHRLRLWIDENQIPTDLDWESQYSSLLGYISVVSKNCILSDEELDSLQFLLEKNSIK